MNRKIREKGGEIYPTGLTMEEAANFLVEKEHSRDHLKREFTKIINGEEVLVREREYRATWDGEKFETEWASAVSTETSARASSRAVVSSSPMVCYVSSVSKAWALKQFAFLLMGNILSIFTSNRQRILQWVRPLPRHSLLSD